MVKTSLAHFRSAEITVPWISLGMILSMPLEDFEQESDITSFRVNITSYDLVSIYTNVPHQNLLFSSVN